MGQLQEERGYFFLKKYQGLIITFILLLQQLFLKNKISGEKSLMIWNFFLLLLKMPSHQKNLWSISFFSLKKVLKNMFCMRSELHFMYYFMIVWICTTQRTLFKKRKYNHDNRAITFFWNYFSPSEWVRIGFNFQMFFSQLYK